MSWIPAAIGAAGDILGSFLGFSGQQSTNKANLKIAREQMLHQEKMVQMQNEYNSPANQMARYREAGLSPHMMYGSISSGNQTNIPTYDAPRMENAYEHIAHGVSGASENFVDNYLRAKDLDANIQVKEAQASYLAAQADYIAGPRTGLGNAQISLLGEQTNSQRWVTQLNMFRSYREEFGHEMEQALKDVTIAIENQKLRNLTAQEKDMYSQITAREVDNILKRHNISKDKFYMSLDKMRYKLEKKRLQIDGLYKSGDLKLRSRHIDDEEYRTTLEAQKMVDAAMRWTEEFMLETKRYYGEWVDRLPFIGKRSGISLRSRK